MKQKIISVLSMLRTSIVPAEYDLHDMVRTVLEGNGIGCLHEASIAPRCRIDFLCGNIGIEIKKGKPDRKRLLVQLKRYAESDMIASLIVVTEQAIDLPNRICGKEISQVCLSRLWGIAL